MRHRWLLLFALASLACSSGVREQEGPVVEAPAPTARPARAAGLVDPAATWSCPSLTGLSPSPPKEARRSNVAEGRRVLASRERDLLACAGVESAWLARLDDGGVGVVVWVESKEDDWVLPRRTNDPRGWLDGVPLLVWMRGPCLLDSRAFARTVTVAEGSSIGEGAERELEAIVEILREHPELPVVEVSGERAARVADWLGTRGIATTVADRPASARIVTVSADATRQCGSRHVYFR